jgi:adenine deaminase
MQIRGNIADVFNQKFFFGEISVLDGKILKITDLGEAHPNALYILPGFVDAHIHIESSMLTPCQFARLAVVHGTVATVSDPHEIANVLEKSGVEYMIENGKQVNFKFFFGCPSCVPATKFETAGAELDVVETDELMRKPEIKYLAEMMNFPGVLTRDEKVMKKILVAKKYKKPVDGHAPGLRGVDAANYAAAGISTDHECFTKAEALDKLACGMKIIIREGSAARNFEELIDLLPEYYEKLMFCSDDKHPDSLVEGHINDLVKRALAKKMDLFQVLQVACVNPVKHYKLEVGLLRENDPADFIIIDNPEKFNILQTYINGELVAEDGKSLIPSQPSLIVNYFKTSLKKPEDFVFPTVSWSLKPFAVIEALDRQLITHKTFITPKVEYDQIVPDLENDVLKITVVNRYRDTKPSVAFIKNFGLKNGAIASSVAHDSHNIIAVGTDDVSICNAVNALIEVKGGISATTDGITDVLPLPVAGLMSGEDGYEIAKHYSELDKKAKEMGSLLSAPFMTLSFMALLVIPSLKISDLGLFDGEKFEFIRVGL